MKPEQPYQPAARLPATGFVRLAFLLGRPGAAGILPVSRVTLWRMVRDKTFPAPIKLSAGLTAWRVEDVRDWIGAVAQAARGQK